MMPIGVLLYVNVDFASKMSYIIKRRSERFIFILGRYDVSFPLKRLRPGEQHLPKLLLCSYFFTDEQ